MSNEHTPGPWSVEWKSPCYWLVRCDGVHLPPSESADCPNRRLIAAAPETKKQRDELLWALEYASERLRWSLLPGSPRTINMHTVLRVIDSVIDKATGAKALTDEILTGGTPEEFTAASLADLERMTEGEER